MDGKRDEQKETGINRRKFLGTMGAAAGALFQGRRAEAATVTYRNSFGNVVPVASNDVAAGLTSPDDSSANNILQRQFRVQRTVEGMVAATPKPSPEAITAFYEAQRASFRNPELFHAAHIVKHVDGDHSEAQARAGIEAALADLERGIPLPRSPSATPIARVMAAISESSPRVIWPVDSFPANGFGLSNAVGNTWEWCCGLLRPALACPGYSHRSRGTAVGRHAGDEGRIVPLPRILLLALSERGPHRHVA
jgi:hypothetical protein